MHFQPLLVFGILLLVVNSDGWWARRSGWSMIPILRYWSRTSRTTHFERSRTDRNLQWGTTTKPTVIRKTTLVIARKTTQAITRKTTPPIGRKQSQCEATGCCWVNNKGRFQCQCSSRLSYSSRYLHRYKRDTGIKVQTILQDCTCTGHEDNTRGKKRPFTVYCRKKIEEQPIPSTSKQNPHQSKEHKHKQMKPSTSKQNTQHSKKKNENQLIPGTSKQDNQQCQLAHNSCVYNGDPHPCRAYNKNNGQAKFYQELLDAIAPQQCNNLKKEGFPCEETTYNTEETCPEINYYFEAQIHRG